MSTTPGTIDQGTTDTNPSETNSSAVAGAPTALTESNPTVSGTASSVEVTVPNTSGTVTFQLIVTDNLGTKSVAATATVEIQGAPTAVLNAPKVVGPGETITLSGADSSAVAPGTIANYAYTMEPPVDVDRNQVDSQNENT